MLRKTTTLVSKFYCYVMLIVFRKKAIWIPTIGMVAVATLPQALAALRDLNPISIRKYGFVRNVVKGNVLNIVDVGANLGHMSILFRKVFGARANIIAFEPFPKSYELLRKNSVNFGFKAFSFGIGSECGRHLMHQEIPSTTSLRQDTSIITNLGRTSFRPARIFDFEATVQCELRQGDEVMVEMGLTSVDLLKIDVEGMECEVLRGLNSTIERFKPVIMIELNGLYFNENDNLSEVLSKLSDSGYTIYTQHRSNLKIWDGKVGEAENLAGVLIHDSAGFLNH